MRTTAVTPDDLRGVFAVPPLCRERNSTRAVDFIQNERLVNHIRKGGVTRLIYGGNAFLYHLTLDEYAFLLDWLNELDKDLWVIPSLGPSFGRALDHASLINAFEFPCAMALPCNDPRDAEGLEKGYREIAEAAGTRLLLYLKDETSFGMDREKGLDAVGRLVDDGVCIGIKYAVVRQDPVRDAYLESLLRRVDRKFIISGIGERPAVVHLRDWKLPGFTTGSGCIAPRLSRQLFEACGREDFVAADNLRNEFIPLEDLRDAWGPARVLHSAVQLAGIAQTGDVPPFVSDLPAGETEQILVVTKTLAERDKMVEQTAVVAD